jgi:hypothetical protein
VSDVWPKRVSDPDGRDVVFDASSHLHLASRKRNALLEAVEDILQAVARPDFRETDPIDGRERFYRADFDRPGQWLLVVVDFNDSPGWVVTVFVTELDPRGGNR